MDSAFNYATASLQSFKALCGLMARYVIFFLMGILLLILLSLTC